MKQKPTRSTRFEMRLTPEKWVEIDEWRRRQPDLPSRTEAIRRLIDAALDDQPPLRKAQRGRSMLLSYKYRLFPARAQAETLDGMLGALCDLYNAALQQRIEAYQRSGKTLRLREKLVKIGAKIVRHGRYLVFQLAEVAVPRALFAEILHRIDRPREYPPPLPA